MHKSIFTVYNYKQGFKKFLLFICFFGVLYANAQNNTITLQSSIGSGFDSNVFGQVADMNGDGYKDIIYWRNGGNFELFLNNGSGGFANSATSLMAVTGQILEIADLDNDGDNDIVCANGSIYANNGSGTMTAVSGLSIKQNAGGTISAIKIIDINGDGKKDIVWVNGSTAANAYHEVWLNTTSGSTLNFAYSYGMPSATTAKTSLDVADIDADGDFDIVMGANGGDAEIWKYNSGGYTLSQIVSSFLSRFVKLLDWNKDGYLDIVAYDNNASSYRYVANNGSGVFSLSINSILTTSANSTFGAVGDLNGDGFLDIVCQTSSGNAQAFINNGCTLTSNYALNSAYNGVLLSDFNNDGKLDVLCVAGYSQSNVWKNDLSLWGNMVAPGNALKFDGANDYVAIADANSLDVTTSYTIEAWINVTSFTSQAGIVSKNQVNGSQGYSLRLTGTSTFSGLDFDGMVTANGILQTGKWYHIAAVKSGATRTLYVNGVAQTLTGTGITTTANTDTLKIGSDFNGRYFNGNIDEVRIWNIARTSTEITSSNKNILGCSNNGLVAYYKFDNGTSGASNYSYYALNDVSGTNNHGLLKNFALANATSNWVESYAMVIPNVSSATNITATSFTANWSAPTVGTATSYSLDVSTSSTFASFVSGYSDVSVSGTSRTVTGLTPGTTYYYRVRAYKTSAASQGPNSSTISAITLSSNTLNGAGLTSTYSSPAAYSLRKLSSVYAGSAIQVRRSSDNATSNIGFTANGDLDTTALKSFVGNNSGYVSIWYDQGGIVQDASQANTALQPQIVNAGVVNRKNGLPTINFNSQKLATASYIGYASAYSLAICAGVSSNTAYPDFGSKTNSNIAAPWNIYGNKYYVGNGTSSNSYNLTYPLDATRGFSQWTFTGNTSTIYAYRNGTSNGSATISNYADASVPLVIGSRNDGVTQLNGWVSEYITLSSVLSASDQQALEANQNAYYFSNNANLANLTISSGTLSPTFTSGTTSYTAIVNSSAITATPTLSNAFANVQVRINGGTYNTVNSGSASTSLSLNAGTNTINILVTAQDGVTTSTYTVTVTRINVLDNAGLTSTYTSPAAFSLRKLSSTYAGNAIQVRRFRDNATSDIGFTASGDLDTTALKTFVGNDVASITTWYDQSGYTQNATQATAALQPLLVNGGIIYRKNGAPTIFFSGQKLATASYTGYANAYSLAICAGVYSNTSYPDFGSKTNTNGPIAAPWNIWGNQNYIGNGSSYTYINLTNPVNATSGFSQWTFIGNTSSINAYRNGSNNASGTTTYYGDAGAPLVLGSRNDGATQLVGWISEYITLNSVLATNDQQTLEANQNTYYFSNNANLSALSINSGTLSPTFSSGITSYTVSVTNAITSVTVTPTLSNAYASIRVRVNSGSYITVNSGSASSSLNLNAGTNTIEVLVTASNGTTTNTYTVTVNRVNTLDNLGLTSTYTSPAAFSLRKLSSNYSGYAIQVRRSSDDATSNIGFTASGDLDTTALKTFIGNNNGFVSIWYDQSGFAQDASQAITSLQPQIVNGGIIYRKNAVPTINFNSQKLATASYTGYASAYSLAVCAGVAGVTAYPDFGSKTNANGGVAAPWNIWGGQSYLGNGSSFTFISLTNPLNVTSGFSQWTFTGSTSSYNAYRNGNNNGSGTTAYYGDAGAPLVIGSRNDGATQLSGWISEYITLNTVLATNDQQTLESNQSSYYFSSDASLSNLVLSSGTLSPIFSSSTTSYAVSVTGSTSSISLTPTFSNANASLQISVNGGAFLSVLNNTASTSLNLNSGLNTISVLVTAQDGTTTKAYTITVTRAVNVWTGGTSTDFSNPNNWSGGTVPTVADDIIINSSSNNPQITGTHLVSNVTINSGASLTVTGTLKIGGSISNSGTLTATSGTVEFNGSSAQSIPANAFTSNTVQNLTINNSAGVTLGGALTVTGVLTPTAGVLTTGGNLTLASSATGTASIAAGSGTYISGNVTTQRYTRAQRGYRTFGHPFNTAQNLGILTDNFRITGLTTNAGSGTYATSTGNPSAFLYDPTQTIGSTSVLTRLTDATANVWAVGKGLYVFVRGAGNEGMGGAGASNYSTLSPVTIDGTGAINQGDVTVNLIYGGVGKDNYNLIGNPYPCPINLKTVTGISSYGTVYVYNPVKNIAGSDQYNVSGGFDQYTNDGSTDIIVPVFGAFYIQATGNGQSLTFKESDKAVGSTPSYTVFGTEKNPRVRLQITNTNGVIDELKLGINSSSSDASTDKYDATKLGNSLFNFYSLSSDKKALAIDYRANLNNTIPLGIQTNLANHYKISLSELTDLPNTQLVLRDKLLNKETILTQVGDSYSFDITADTTTKGENRFEIGLLGTTVLPVQIADITAQLQANKAVAVNWTSTAEVNLAKYNVQRSKDGSNFSTVGTVAAKGVSTYSYSDDLSTAGVLPATIYYRLEAVDKDGSKTFSKVVAVALGSNLAKAAINIYPNPVQATLFAQVTVTKAGAAQLRVVDAQGKVVATQKTQLAVGTTSVSIPAAQLAAGNYVLEIDSADGKQTQRFVKE